MSAKDLNDVLNDLLSIEDFEYVKKELTQVLKSETHTFKELTKIE